MTDDELSALVRAEIDSALSFDKNSLATDRARVTEYYNGELKDIAALPGRSSVTSHDLADTIGWVLPGLMRVFLSTDRIVVYLPKTEADKAFAQQATDYVNYIFLNRCEGYRVLWSACHDALLFGNGVFKHWWEPPTEESTVETERATGLNEEMLTALLQEPGVELLEATPTDKDGMVYYDVKIKRTTNHCGKLCIEAVPPEEFLIDRSAKSTEDASFMAHRQLMTRSDLIKRGYPRDLVDSIGDFSQLDVDEEKQAREEDTVIGAQRTEKDMAREKVEIFECMVSVDYDGDGITEWRKVVYAGVGDNASMLDNVEWTDPPLFTDLTGHPVPHRRRGRSIADDTMDIMRIKTVLLRQALDNLYATNNPQMEAVEASVINPEELLNPSFGGVVRVREAGSVNPLAVPFVAQHSFSALEYMDQMLQKRTGVSQRSMALDANTLTNQTATAAQLQADASYSKVELIARNMSELGLKTLFKRVLALVTKHQNVPDTVRLRDKPAVVEPGMWNSDMDVSIDIGLGAGSREKDFMALMQISMKQEQILQMAGPDNPFVDGTMYANTLAKMVESAGFKSSASFFKDPNPQEMAAYAEKVANAPDPELAKEQAKAEAQKTIEGNKLQANIQLEQAKMAVATEKEKAQAQADLVTKQADLQMQERAAERQYQLEVMKMQAQAQIEREKLQAQIMLEREKMAQQREVEAAKVQAARESARMNVEQKREAGFMAAEAKSDD